MIIFIAYPFEETMYRSDPSEQKIYVGFILSKKILCLFLMTTTSSSDALFLYGDEISAETYFTGKPREVRRQY